MADGDGGSAAGCCSCWACFELRSPTGVLVKLIVLVDEVLRPGEFCKLSFEVVLVFVEVVLVVLAVLIAVSVVIVFVVGDVLMVLGVVAVVCDCELSEIVFGVNVMSLC